MITATVTLSQNATGALYTVTMLEMQLIRWQRRQQ